MPAGDNQPPRALILAEIDLADVIVDQLRLTGDREHDLAYSFLTSESDPDATDFTEATKLLQTQLAKAAQAFAR